MDTPNLSTSSGGRQADASDAAAVVSREWVGALVQEMSGATDVPDAHERATRVLQAFEASVRSAVAGESAAAGGGGGASACASLSSL